MKASAGSGPGRLEEGLARRMGVTRIARVTGLDRSGVEVAAAIRPGGHVLQVCNGKGGSWSDARRGALMETAELAYAERVQSPELIWGCRRELLARWPAANLYGADALGSAGVLVRHALWSDEVVCAWKRARDLWTGREVLVVAQGLHCPPGTGPDLGPVSVNWTSNGSGAHDDADAALVHALLEAIEREQLRHAAPDGWTAEVVMSARIARAGLRRAAPNTAALMERLEQRGFRVELFDLCGPLPLPVAGALLIDREGGPVPLTAGYACGLDRDGALLSALREAAQSRLTDIHGAREDVSATSSDEVSALCALLDSTTATRPITRMPPGPRTDEPGKTVAWIIRRLRAQGINRGAVAWLQPADEPVKVAKVVIPSWGVSELLS